MCKDPSESKSTKLRFCKTRFKYPNTKWLGLIPDPPAEQPTVFGYFQMFFTEEVFENISEQSDIYSLQKFGPVLASSKEEYKKCIGVWLHMGIVHMTLMKLY